MRTLALFLALLAPWPAFLHAQDDWLSLPVPQPLSGSTRAELGLAVGSGEAEGWVRGQDEAVFSPVTWASQSLKQVSLDLALRAKLSGTLVIEAHVPLVFTELSPWEGANSVVFSPQDPAVRREQGLGDIQVGLRGALFGAPGGFQGGWSVGAIAPTGLSPFDAKAPLLATGAGRWQGLLGLVVGGGQDGPIESWLWAQGRYQAGRQAWASPQATLAFGGDGVGSYPINPNESGQVWLDPRWGGDLDYGLGWNWYRDAESRHSLAIEFIGHALGPWSINGRDQGVGPEWGLWAQPELIFRFGRFNASGGVRLPPIPGANNELVFDDGLMLINASYAF
jgi:hypothetical protein